MLRRIWEHCLLRPQDFQPSHEALEIVSVFNPGVADLGDDVLLLVRVAERPRRQRPETLALPRWQPGKGLVIDHLPASECTLGDPRIVTLKDGSSRLTFISHLRIVRLRHGREVACIDDVMFMPENSYETYGVEDPRITRIGEVFYITYVAVSMHGAATALTSTRDFKTFQRHGIIFPPENKDVVLFPEKIGGEYVALHRPNPSTHFAPPEMWLARSRDLIHWGRHQRFLGADTDWAAGRVGAGTPPIRTDQGWLTLYHGNDKRAGVAGVGRYFAAALLLDLDNPAKILAHTPDPILSPDALFETTGFVPNIVFPTGLAERGENLLIYYGAADTVTAVVQLKRQDVLDAMRASDD
jgi:predicted GH43/DUF377 family glycosyl hydrolase